MKKLFLLFSLLVCLNTTAFAGGGNGSEVLGPVKGGTESSENFMDSLKNMLSGKKNADGSSASDENNGGNNSKNNNSGNNNSTSSGMPMDCTVTPSIYPDNIPEEKIKKGNNLLRKPGSARRANGQYVTIIGKVVDEDCIPISNAEVQIWQADSAGKYEDEYKLKSEWDVLDKDYDKNFGYSGAAQTNNLGEFSFLTILPKAKNDNMAPHINFFVRHPDFQQVASMMFFSKHPKNDSDKNLNEPPAEKRELVMANGRKIDAEGKLEGRVYSFVVTLGGINKYRRY